MIILGIDPGIARLGWAVVQENKGKLAGPVYGCIETPKNMPVPDRLLCLYDKISRLIKNHRPDVASVEELYMAANTKTAISVGQARGVAILAAGKNGLNVYSYTPLVIKLTICGWGKADKKQVQIMTQKLLQLPSVPRPDDAADALAVAITHAFSYKMKELNL